MRILIVDDENPIRELLRLYFEKEQFEVLEAENGANGIKARNISRDILKSLGVL